MDGQLRRHGTEMWQRQTERHTATKSNLETLFIFYRADSFLILRPDICLSFVCFFNTTTQRQQRQRQNVNPCIKRKSCGPNKQVRSPPSQTVLMFSLRLSSSCPLFPSRPPPSLCQHRQSQPAAIISPHLLGPFSGQEPPNACLNSNQGPLLLEGDIFNNIK